MELKPCPFCGLANAPAVERYSETFDIYDENPAGHVVVCASPDGGCGASTGWHSTPAEAIAAWNTRVAEGET